MRGCVLACDRTTSRRHESFFGRDSIVLRYQLLQFECAEISINRFECAEISIERFECAEILIKRFECAEISTVVLRMC